MKNYLPKQRRRKRSLFIAFIVSFCSLLLSYCDKTPPSFELEKKQSDDFMAAYQDNDLKLLSDSAELSLDTLIQKLSAYQPYSNKYLMQAVLVKANHISNEADYENSNEACFDLLSGLSKTSKRDTSVQLLYAEIHSLIGYNLDKMLKYEAAINHYEKSIIIYEAFGQHVDAAGQYSNQCLSYVGLGNFVKAGEVADIGKGILDTIARPGRKELMLQSHNRMVRANAKGLLGQYYKESNQIEAMKACLNESNTGYLYVTKFFKKSKSIPPQIYTLYGNLAANYTLLGSEDLSYVDSAIYYLEKLIPTYSRKEGGLIQPELLGFFQGLLATNYFRKGQFQSALFQIDEALKSTDYFDYKKEANGDLLIKQHPNRLLIGVNLGLKGMIYLQRYIDTGDEKYLEQSNLFLAEAVAVIESFALDFSSERMLINYKNRLEVVFRTYLFVYLEYFRLTKNNEYFEKAFTVSEQFKNFTLRQGLNRQVLSFYIKGERKAIMDQEQKIEVKRRSLNQKIRKDLSNKSVLIDSLLLLEEQEALFLNDLKNSDSPIKNSYYLNRYDQTVPDLNTIRKDFVNSNTALIEYHFSGETPVVMIITETTLSFVPLKIDDKFYEHFDELMEESLPYENLERYKINVHEIYKSIFKPLEHLLSPEINQLVIVPDNALRALPFDILLSEIPANDVAINEYPFLLNKYAIGYVYSVSAYHLAEELRASKTRKPSLDFIGFNASPDDGAEKEYTYYEGCNGTSLEALTKATSSIAEFFPANRKRIFKKAQKADFVEHASKADVLYLAMHGCVGERTPLDYGLQFLGAEDRLLTVNEILDLSLNARLVVLGSCNTESIQLSLGEGTASIARAFRRTGCLNMIASLNVVNDKYGAMIYEQFYKNWIEKGDNTIMALAKAKRSLLNNPKLKSGDKSPRKWGGIISIGKPIYWKD